MKNILVILILLYSISVKATLFKYKIEYIGTKVVAYSNTEVSYEGRKDIIIYQCINGKYIKVKR